MMDGTVYLTWLEAQAYCKSVGTGNNGRLATFSSCAAYTAIKTNWPASNAEQMWIGIQSAQNDPYWADPYSVCSPPEMLNDTEPGGSCASSAWNPGVENCIAISGAWGDFDGQPCSNSIYSILCEFGKFRNTLYEVVSITAVTSKKDKCKCEKERKNGKCRIYKKTINAKKQGIHIARVHNDYTLMQHADTKEPDK